MSQRIEAGYHPFDPYDVAVATNGHVKRVLARETGTPQYAHPDALSIIDEAERRDDIENRNGVVLHDRKWYSVLKAMVKAEPLLGYHETHEDASRRMVVTDSTHFLSAGDETFAFDKHDGDPDRFDQLMSFYHQMPGARVITTSGLAIIDRGADNIVLYDSIVNWGTFNPTGIDRFATAPQISGGYSTIPGAIAGIVDLDPYIHVMMRRLGTPDQLRNHSEQPMITGGSLIARDVFTGHISSDPANFQQLGRINLGFSR